MLILSLRHEKVSQNNTSWLAVCILHSLQRVGNRQCFTTFYCTVSRKSFVSCYLCQDCLHNAHAVVRCFKQGKSCYRGGIQMSLLTPKALQTSKPGSNRSSQVAITAAIIGIIYGYDLGNISGALLGHCLQLWQIYRCSFLPWLRWPPLIHRGL